MVVHLKEVPTLKSLSGKSIRFIKNGTPWKTITTNGSGHAGTTDNLSTPGTYNYYAEFLGDDEYLGCEAPISQGGRQAERSVGGYGWLNFPRISA